MYQSLHLQRGVTMAVTGVDGSGGFGAGRIMPLQRTPDARGAPALFRGQAGALSSSGLQRTPDAGGASARAQITVGIPADVLQRTPDVGGASTGTDGTGYAGGFGAGAGDVAGGGLMGLLINRAATSPADGDGLAPSSGGDAWGSAPSGIGALVGRATYVAGPATPDGYGEPAYGATTGGSPAFVQRAFVPVGGASNTAGASVTVQRRDTGAVWTPATTGRRRSGPTIGANRGGTGVAPDSGPGSNGSGPAPAPEDAGARAAAEQQKMERMVDEVINRVKRELAIEHERNGGFLPDFMG